MSEELYSVEVVNLTFKQVGALPQIAHCWDIGVIAVGINSLYAHALVCFGVFKNINCSQSFFTKIFTYDSNEEVEMLLILQFCHLAGKILQFEYFIF